MEQKNIMTPEKILPADFDGVFRFTNWSDEEFIARWDSKDYHFAAQTTSPMLMPTFSPVEIQQIRKKFAKDLAEREFFKSKKYAEYLGRERNPDGTPKYGSLHGGTAYTLDELAPFIQKCLEPLPVSKVLVEETKKRKVEDTLSRNESGELNTKALDKKDSLRAKALAA